MKIALSSDHAGYERLKILRKFLEGLGHECQWFGPTGFEADDDYPDFIRPAAEAVGSGDCQMGIIMGGSGQGEAMAANRVSKVRCAVYYGPSLAKYAIDASGKAGLDEFDVLRLTRAHNDANMLSFGVRFLTDEEMARAAQIWLDTPFSNDDRHARRIKKLDQRDG